MKYISLITVLIPLILAGCAKPNNQTSTPAGQTASTNDAPDHVRALRLLAAVGASEAIIEDAKNSAVLKEVSDALDVFCGNGKIDSLFLIQLIAGLPDRLNISEKTRLRLAMAGLLLDELGGQITPSDYVAWGGAGCAVREGIKRGIEIAKAAK